MMYLINDVTYYTVPHGSPHLSTARTGRPISPFPRCGRGAAYRRHGKVDLSAVRADVARRGPAPLLPLRRPGGNRSDGRDPTARHGRPGGDGAREARCAERTLSTILFLRLPVRALATSVPVHTCTVLRRSPWYHQEDGRDRVHDGHMKIRFTSTSEQASTAPASRTFYVTECSPREEPCCPGAAMEKDKWKFLPLHYAACHQAS